MPPGEYFVSVWAVMLKASSDEETLKIGDWNLLTQGDAFRLEGWLTVFIGAGGSFQAEKDEVPDEADDRDKDDEEEPPPSIGVV